MHLETNLFAIRSHFIHLTDWLTDWLTESSHKQFLSYTVSFGQSPGVWAFSADVSELTGGSIFIGVERTSDTPQFQSWVSLVRSTPMKMELPVSSETSELKVQTPGDYPKDTIRHSTHSESLKSSSLANLSINSQDFTSAAAASRRSKEHATCHYTNWINPANFRQLTSLTSILILTPHLRLYLLSGFFPSVLPTQHSLRWYSWNSKISNVTCPFVIQNLAEIGQELSKGRTAIHWRKLVMYDFQWVDFHESTDHTLKWIQLAYIHNTNGHTWSIYFIQMDTCGLYILYKWIHVVYILYTNGHTWPIYFIQMDTRGLYTLYKWTHVVYILYTNGYTWPIYFIQMDTRGLHTS